MTATDRARWIDEYAPPPLVDPLTDTIRDLTMGGLTVKQCTARAMVRGDDGPTMQDCTRRDGHTGRHAAGAGSRIVAVWGERHQPKVHVPAGTCAMFAGSVPVEAIIRAIQDGAS